MRLLKAFIITMFFTSVATAATPGQQLQKLLNNTQSLTANFIQKNYGANGKVLQNLRGHFAMEKPGKFLWVITKPSEVKMVSNGQLLWIYQKNLKQVTVKKIDKNKGSSPAMVLSNRIRLLTNYFTVWKKGSWFYLSPRYSNDELKQVQLSFNKAKLNGMWILDKLGQKSYIRFSNVKLNRNLSDTQFTFKIPRDVDVIR